MRGSVTNKRFGVMPNFLLNHLLKERKVRKNSKNPALSYLVLYFVSIADLVREKILKPTYRSLPVPFKVWYDKIRYKV